MGQEQPTIIGPQIVAARGLLQMSQEALAGAVGIDVSALSRIENGHAVPRPRTLSKIRATLEAYGIGFTNGDKPCVCLDRSKATLPR